MITPAVMREAGWEIAEVGDNGPATPKEYRNRYQRWTHRTEWNSCDQCRHDVFYDLHTGLWSQNGKDVTYMDEIKPVFLPINTIFYNFFSDKNNGSN